MLTVRRAESAGSSLYRIYMEKPMGKFSGYLLVTDYDDTFCPEHGCPVPEENLRAAREFMEEGGLFTVATGRDVRSYYSIRHRFTVNAPVVLSNGAVLFDSASNTIRSEITLPPSCREELTAARDAFPGTGMEVHCGENVHVCGATPNLEQHLARMGVPVAETEPESIPLPWTKVVLIAQGNLFGESDASHAIAAWIRENFPGKYEATPSGAFVDVVAAGSDKGAGVRKLAELLGIEREKVICLGDGWNDIPMLRIAGHAFVPASALEGVKALECVTVLGESGTCIRDALQSITDAQERK